MATITAHTHPALHWMKGLMGAFQNAYHFMCLFNRSDRELQARGLDRDVLIDSYIHSFDRD